MVQCRTLYGHTKLIPVEKLRFRPSAYAIAVHDNNILLVKMRSTGAYCLPGGGIHLGERIEDGLKREVKEETGVELIVQQLAHFRDDFFYYDPSNEAFHSFLFFYVCKPVTTDLISDDQVEDIEAEMPRWVEICTLKAEYFYNDGETIMSILAPH
jgi:8-oxo-dGTP diphosphatase